MITETYTKRDSGEIITISEKHKVINIGDKIYKLTIFEIIKIKKLYKYDKEIFKEFIENIYTKYNLNIINFLIKNKVTLKDIKELNNIILFPISLNAIILSNYGINIINLFKYIYSQPHEYINYFLEKYSTYLYEMKKRKKLNKYNIFPHNLFLSYIILFKDKIKRKNSEDTIKDMGYLFKKNLYILKCLYPDNFTEIIKKISNDDCSCAFLKHISTILKHSY